MTNEHRFSNHDEPTAESSSEFATRAMQFLDGLLDDTDRRAFGEELKQDAEKRQQFVALCIQAGLVGEALAQDRQSGKFEKRLRPTRRMRMQQAWRTARAKLRATTIYLSQPASLSLLIASLSLGLLIGLLAWRSVPPANLSPIAQKTPREAKFVGRLVWMSEPRWSETGPAPHDGSLLRQGERLELASGTAMVVYDSGVQVLLQGETRIGLNSNNSVELDAGRVTCLVPHTAVGFAVLTPQCAVIDLGTEFGVESQPTSGSQVHVFQGEVRVETTSSESGRVVKAGEAVRVATDARGKITSAPLAADQFARPKAVTTAANSSRDKSVIVANFDSNVFGSEGWLTAWNMHGEGLVYRDVRDPLAGDGNAYLQVALKNAADRTMRRKYGAHGEVDPAKPHIIRWKWRFDGDLKQLTNFNDRVHFFADSHETHGSTHTNSWLIGIAFGVQDDRRPPLGTWYFFDSQRSGKHSSHHDARNMVDTGLPLVAGTVYSFEVVVYPETGTYDASMSNGTERFAAQGLHFRRGSTGTAQVLHFGGCASAAGEDHTFALDSIEIRPFNSLVNDN